VSEANPNIATFPPRRAYIVLLLFVGISWDYRACFLLGFRLLLGFASLTPTYAGCITRGRFPGKRSRFFRRQGFLAHRLG
jgi:hypothetical protein